MKKGFTLIELLAVIVILAIIALIATPIVLSIINDSKESAILRSGEFYLNAVETAIMRENMKGKGTLERNECMISSDGNVICDERLIEVEVDGKKPTSGSITYENGKIVQLTLKYGNDVVSKNSSGKLIYSQRKDLADITSTTNTCVNSGTCALGTLLTIKVNDKTTYDFYVIGDDGKKVTLIMNRNLINGVVWNENGIIGGPLTSLEKLKELTNDWTNINLFDYTIEVIAEKNCINYYEEEDLCMEYDVKMDTLKVDNVRARLPKEQELDSWVPNYLISNLNLYEGDGNPIGYWLSDFSTDFDYANVRFMHKIYDMSGYPDSTSPNKSNIYPSSPDWEIGIRPVIEIYK